MTGIYNVRWTVEPTTAPRPWKLCSSCGEIRPFLSSGKIRLNANGRKLDAWLIYRCSACERTWNRPIAERLTVASVSKADLHAMEKSDPSWVRIREFDLGALRRHCDRIEMSPEVSVARASADGSRGSWSAIVVTIDALQPTGQRLDRLLAAELKVSRSSLTSMHRAGALQIEPGSRAGLKKLVGGRLAVRFVASRISEEHRMAIEGRVFA